MKLAATWISFLSISLFFKCGSESEECPSDGTNLGNQDFDSITQRFQPYDAGEIITLTNLENEVIELTVTNLDSERDRVYVRKNCSDGFYSVSDYYLAEEQVLTIVSDDQSVQIRIEVSINSTFISFSEIEGVLFDYFQASLSDNQAAALLSFVTSKRGNDDDLRLITRLEDLRQEFLFAETLELNGKSFSEVYYTSDGPTVLYYSPDIGVIGLKIDNVLYVI